MEIYRVGGAVRDRLLGLAVQDHDFVVVGATVEQMLAQGFIPVGKDFPVFLHPTTHQEYALARTERKSGRGYRGFQVDASATVTLEQDLSRRDLTINAMAEDQAGQLIDPFLGQHDLKAGLLRHVSPAFSEDPVRILRVARFAARFQFNVAPETMVLMREMVQHGEADALVPERVWQEISRGLMEVAPARMFEVLIEAGALPVILPELAADLSATVTQRLNAMAQQQESLLRRFVALTFALTEPALLRLAKRLRVPQAFLSIARLLCQEKAALTHAAQLDAITLRKALLRCDAVRRFPRFAEMVAIMRWCIAEQSEQTRAFLVEAAQALAGVDGRAIAAGCANTHDIAAAIAQAQHDSLSKVLAAYRQSR